MCVCVCVLHVAAFSVEAGGLLPVVVVNGWTGAERRVLVAVSTVWMRMEENAPVLLSRELTEETSQRWRCGCVPASSACGYVCDGLTGRVI